MTPYQFTSNRPIEGIDIDGLEYGRYDADLDPGLSAINIIREERLYYNDVILKASVGGASIIGIAIVAPSVPVLVEGLACRGMTKIGLRKLLVINQGGQFLVGFFDDGNEFQIAGGADDFGRTTKEGVEILGNYLDDLADINKRAKGADNCEGCALTADAIVKGRETSVLGDEFANPLAVIRNLTLQFGESSIHQKFVGVSYEMLKLGDGTTGIVTLSVSGNNKGHAFNDINEKGVFRIFDTQNNLNEIGKDQLSIYLESIIRDGEGTFRLFDTTGQ